MSGNQSDPLDRDELFDILSNGRRRYVLEYLSRADGPVDFETLTEKVAAWESDTPVEALERAERKRIYVSLYQSHLPRLEDAGMVRFDREAGIVELQSRATELVPYVGDGPPPSSRWPLIYGATALAGLVALVTAWLDLGVAAAVPDLTVGALSVAVLVVAGLAHRRSIRRGRSSTRVTLIADRE